MKRDNTTIRNVERASTDIPASLVIRELIPKRRHINVKTVMSQHLNDITESILVRNLTPVKNVGSPLTRSQHFTVITESILVRNLTHVKNVASPLLVMQTFKLTTESILVRNHTHVKNVANPLLVM
ncbi:Zinc finger protein 781 [Lemmus lemmus]